ncbi:MAG TPA: DUF3575 domain-containing protein [Spirochaetota bacterium]|nr:DUF3575 domain-containing protein [Spirochaetota bacterium]HPK55793.1 DUF3575 domain-containing protein [Spirochaetota bacterium]
MSQFLKNIFKCMFVFMLLVLTVRDIRAEETAAPEENKTFSFTLYPCPLPFRWFSAEAEYAFSNNFTLAIEGKYWDYYETDERYDWKWKRLETSLGIRGYAQKAMEGIFAGIYLNYLYLDLELDDRYFEEISGQAKFKTFGATGWIGYKWIISNAVLEVSTGVTYYALGNAELTVNDSYTNETYKETSPLKLGLCWSGIGLGLGIAF